jgi:folate-binding protein YgfZ
VPDESPRRLEENAAGAGRRAPRSRAESDLAHLRQDAGVRIQGRGDVLRIEGADRIDLLHRLAATALLDAAVGDRAAAVFTDDKGRILDVSHLCFEADSLLALAGAGQGIRLRDWIERFTITEDVRGTILGDSTVLTLVGADAVPRAAAALRLTSVPAENGFARSARGDLLLPTDRHFSESGLLMIPDPARVSEILEALERQGLPRVEEAAYRQWWIEQGYLGPGPELASGMNPLEAGLRDLISWDKGCYVGQEVVARLDTYDKVKRQVAVFRGTGAVEPRAPLRDDAGRPLGRVLAAMSRLDGPGRVGLALVPRNVAPGQAVFWNENGAGTFTQVPAPR